MSDITNTPTPPYYAVIFTSTLNAAESQDNKSYSDDTNAYHTTANRMLELAASQPGFLGSESAREALGITVSYWDSLDAIKNWKAQPEHLIAQQNGKQTWYSEYKVRIAKVERDYGFD